MAVVEIEREDLLVDVGLTHHGWVLLTRLLHSSMHKAGVVTVETVKVARRFVQQGVVLTHEFPAHALRTGRFHDHDNNKT
jgi:hypothetical protein